MPHTQLIGIAGLAAWLLVGLPAFASHFAAGIPWDLRWVAAFVLFGALFAADLRRPWLPLLAGQSAAAIVLLLLRCGGYEGTLLALVAMQLGPRVEPVAGTGWIGFQTLLLGAALAAVFNTRSALLLLPPYLGFQLLAYFTFRTMACEAVARRALASANAELRAVQEILAGSSRLAERLRIARELHDALGHRLTAVSLNLEAALQRVSGPARASVETAQGLARQLLAEVRAIVADSVDCDGLPLAQALQTLVASVPRPRVHLGIDSGLRVVDPEQAHVLLRCTQEIVTNAARHSGAENLWISIEQQDDAVRICARDDGRGSARASAGFGLRGMRERVERLGGQLHIETQAGRGFGLTALLPIRGGAT